MEKLINPLCVAGLILSIFTVIAGLITEINASYRIALLAWFLFSGSILLLAVAGAIAVTRFNSRLVIASLLLLFLFYMIRSQQFIQLNSARSNQQYTFTTDWVTAKAYLWLERLAPFKDRPDTHALEIGSYEGRSAIWFLENILTDPSSSITCIDIFNGPFEKAFDENMKRFDSKVTKIKGPSQQMLRRLEPNSFDFIYIDGSHVAKDVFLDAALSWDLLKPGGLIIFDDYEWLESVQNPRLLPKPAIDAFLAVFEPHYVDLEHKGYQVIVRKRKLT